MSDVISCGEGYNQQVIVGLETYLETANDINEKINVCSLSRAKREGYSISRELGDCILEVNFPNRGFVAWGNFFVGAKSSRTVFSHDGANGSFHETWFNNPLTICWGRTPQQAVARVKNQIQNRKHIDTAELRFKYRRLVREGD